MTGLKRRVADTDARQKLKEENYQRSHRLGYRQEDAEHILKDALEEFSKKMSGPVKLKIPADQAGTA